LVDELSKCKITGLNQEQRRERDILEERRRQLKKAGQRLSRDDEARRNELGDLARTGPVQVEAPFGILLDWWQTSEDDQSAPKTWAGRQEIHKIATAAQEALVDRASSGLFDYACVLRLPHDYRKGRADHKKAVEPFYFDARRFAHPLDAGFSLDVQDAETVAHPAVELLCLIALQRFRPSAVKGQKWLFEYTMWSGPLPAAVAPAVVCGVVAGDRRYRFPLVFRDDQKRYKAFGLATPIGGGQ
jgi:CRISPR-associated protein Csb3